MNSNNTDRVHLFKDRALISDGFWVTSSQVIASAGHLAGIRILTEVLPTDVFGTFFLCYGAVVLVAAAIANPTMQALLRFYPEYYPTGEGMLPRVVARRQLQKLSLWTLPAILAGAAVFLLWRNDSGLTVILLIALATSEIIRTQNLVLLNAIRSQRVYGAWVALEAWSRPLFAGALVLYFDASLKFMLLGYLAATLAILLVMRKWVPGDDRHSGEPPRELVSRFWRYTLPLLPLGILGWISGQADRYIIGAILTAADVGVYVAVYGLVSRAYLQAGTILELVMRPLYYQVLREGEVRHAARIERRWLLALVLVSASGLVVISVFHRQISLLLLGGKYRGFSFLMPVIALGYSLFLLSNFYSRICYARDLTKAVLKVELIGAAASILLAVPFISAWGIKGAAFAVPCYFGIKVLAARRFAKAAAAP